MGAEFAFEYADGGPAVLPSFYLSFVDLGIGAAADAGLRIGKPSGAGALKMATREEEKKAKEERRAKRKAAMSKDPEQARKELKERLAGYGTGEARATAPSARAPSPSPQDMLRRATVQASR